MTPLFQVVLFFLLKGWKPWRRLHYNRIFRNWEHIAKLFLKSSIIQPLLCECGWGKMFFLPFLCLPLSLFLSLSCVYMCLLSSFFFWNICACIILKAARSPEYWRNSHLEEWTTLMLNFGIQGKFRLLYSDTNKKCSFYLDSSENICLDLKNNFLPTRIGMWLFYRIEYIPRAYSLENVLKMFSDTFHFGTNVYTNSWGTVYAPLARKSLVIA